VLTLNSKKIIIISNELCIFDAIIENISHYLAVSDVKIIKHENSKNLSAQLQSDNNFVYQIENISLLGHSKEKIPDTDKVDILIIDDSNFNSCNLFRINFLINFTDNVISNHEIKIVKPFRLLQLFELILRGVNSNIFCCINQEWVYSQKNSAISSPDNSILLTEKENSLFAHLLALDGFKAEKDYLKCKVWNYHEESESNTINTHLYKLKYKLPAELLQIQNTYCFLKINTIN
jgi:hypothetical protein